MNAPHSLSPKTTYTAVVGRVLALRRQQLDREQAHIAAALGVTQPTWSRIENGETALSVEQLVDVARVLETSSSDILRNVEWAMADLQRQGIEVQKGSPKDLAKEGLAMIGVMALGALVLAALSSK